MLPDSSVLLVAIILFHQIIQNIRIKNKFLTMGLLAGSCVNEIIPLVPMELLNKIKCPKPQLSKSRANLEECIDLKRLLLVLI